MSASLLVLCLAAFAMVAGVVSGLVAMTLGFWDRVAARLAPRHRVRLWLGLATLPTAVGLMMVTASLLPAVGIGHDHCLAHGPHHPHLCPHHPGGAPGIVLVFVGLLVAFRAAGLAVGFARGLRSSHAASRCLAEASDRRDGVLVFASDEPQAFVLGPLRPRVHVSRALLALGRAVVEPVVAHERVHARRHDLLWRALCPVLAAGHLPSVLSSLRSRLAAAQELAADAEAGDTMRDGRIKIAEALVLLAKLARTPSPGIAFTHGDIQARVHALLEERHVYPAWPLRAVLVAGLVVPLAIGSAHVLVHHGLETVLGALS